MDSAGLTLDKFLSVWVQGDGTDPLATGDGLILMGLDTDDGRSERVILGDDEGRIRLLGRDPLPDGRREIRGQFLDIGRLAPDDPRLNPYGGAIACGHPLAATGVRLLAQLAYGFERRPDVRYGLTALCIGLGMGAALLWENPRHG